MMLDIRLKQIDSEYGNSALEQRVTRLIQAIEEREKARSTRRPLQSLPGQLYLFEDDHRPPGQPLSFKNDDS